MMRPHPAIGRGAARLLLFTGLLAGAVLAHGPAWAAGNADRGKEIYGRCVACHALERNRTGPKHCGLVGRQAGGVDGFRYSKAMRDSGIVWNAETLDAFLADTRGFIPRNKMGYAGIKDAGERADLIAYLMREADPAVCAK